MQEVARVDEFQSLKHLIRKHQHGFERELSLAVVEQVLEGRTEQIDDHNVVVTFNSEPVHIRNTNSTLQDTVQLGFIK